MVTGSVAAIFYGEPRLTHDIDMVLFFSPDQIPQFLTAFPERDFYCPPEEVITLELKRTEHAHFNLIHHKSGLKADCYPNTGDKLELWAYENRTRAETSKDLSIWLAPPEYVIIRKMQYFREGKSQKHLKDIQAILQFGNVKLNVKIMEKWMQTFVLKDIWEKVIN
jgi:hypothetical protein